MKTFHPLSFALGLASGLLVLLILAGSWRLIRPAPNPGSFPMGGNFQEGGAGLSRMAERLGMTEADLQKELDSGKTLQEIAAERGVEMPAGGRGMRTGRPSSASGTVLGTGTGTASLPSADDGRAVSSPPSQQQ
ncbi:MAG: hypothetical protein WCV62_01400 [Candidatus Peribacteraceae bacterium]|jgi:hypothetical protein